jgi:hypothetical protein
MQGLEAESNGRDEMDLLYDVKAAANFMAVLPLLEIICMWMMFKVEKLKTREEVSEIFQ